ncbi:DUF5348 domain-containing protein [Robertmurraya kyonggiensis]|uniref:DUF5348 domain-containing protein n=1 Tax=Robertmurraya kyonggiensis TaxID=1037680 RepID=A0A4U1D3K9_9BACI|nr:DUF5348 domain-containing protein [Robertmurraya kyonggiensis]TKC15706.1 hypothetical protein FA727_16410 [Robertmurraya kyonggiensis]
MYFNKSSKDISLEDAKYHFLKVKSEIKDLLYELGDDCENLRVNRENLDQEFMKDQYRILTESLEDIYYRLEYLTKPVVEQGYIKHNDAKRYALPSGTYFTSGSTCEILYNDTKYDEQYWLYTSIEHNGSDYYAKALGPDVSINGMMVRVRK